jgi:hypothetical protein
VDVALTQGVYRLLRFEFKGSGTAYEPVQRLNMGADPIDDTASSWTGPGSFRYYARRSLRSDDSDRAGTSGAFSAWKFYFSPPPSAVYSLRIYYIPPPPITIGTSSSGYTDFPNEYPEYVVADVCAKLAAKMKEDPGPFFAERDRIKDRIEKYAMPHQANMPIKIADMRRLEGEQDGDQYWRR